MKHGLDEVAIKSDVSPINAQLDKWGYFGCTCEISNIKIVGTSTLISFISVSTCVRSPTLVCALTHNIVNVSIVQCCVQCDV